MSPQCRHTFSAQSCKIKKIRSYHTVPKLSCDTLNLCTYCVNAWIALSWLTRRTFKKTKINVKSLILLSFDEFQFYMNNSQFHKCSKSSKGTKVHILKIRTKYSCDLVIKCWNYVLCSMLMVAMQGYIFYILRPRPQGLKKYNFLSIKRGGVIFFVRYIVLQTKRLEACLMFGGCRKVWRKCI